jgi:hypothetical protein
MGGREQERDCEEIAGAEAGGDAGAGGIDDSFYDGEAKAAVGAGFGAGRIAAPEALENVVKLAGLEAGAGIWDRKLDFTVFVQGKDFDTAGGVGVFEGVFDKIFDYNFETGGIERAQKPGGEAVIDRDIFSRYFGHLVINEIIEGFADVYFFEIEADLIIIEPGYHKKTLDNGLHFAGDDEGRGESGFIISIVPGTQESDLERALETRKRGTELVGDIGTQAFFTRERILESCDHAVELSGNNEEFGRSGGEIETLRQITSVNEADLVCHCAEGL